MPAISVVITTFNSEGFIKSCLDAVFIQDYKGSEVVIIDNGSRDGTVGIIKENYAQVRLIENKKNLGACKARNQGIDACNEEWILTLDCDTVIERDFFSHALGVINRMPKDIGAVQPKILCSDKKTIYSAGIFLSPLRRFYDIGKGKVDIGQFDEEREIFGSCAAASLYRRKMLNEIKEKSGYFDERFFFLVEDVDLSWRAKKQGWRTYFCPSVVCCHFGDSSKTDNEVRQLFCFRNRQLMISKNETFLVKFKLFILSFWYEVIRFLYLILFNKYILSFKGRIAENTRQ